MANISYKCLPFRTHHPAFLKCEYDIRLSEVRRMGSAKAHEGVLVSVMLDGIPDTSGGDVEQVAREKAIQVLRDALAALRQWRG